MEPDLTESTADRAATNLDWLSLRRNAEIDIEIHGSRMGEQMVEMFAVDRADCEAFSLDEWHARSPLRRVQMRLVALADPLI